MIQAPQTAQLLRAAIGQFESGHLEEARQHCHQVLRLEPMNEDAHHTLGVIELRSGHRDAAVVQISRAIALDASKSEYHNSMGAIFAEGKEGDATRQRSTSKAP